MNILFIGDIVGKVGRKALLENLSFVKNKYKIDFVIANGENITNGRGISRSHYNFLLEHGVDVVTLGNHYKDKDEIYKYIDFADEMIRPLNLKEDFPGEGSKVFDVDGVQIRVTNVLCEAFMKVPVTDPYQALMDVILEDESDIHIIDLHGESTGEKKAIAYALKNTVSAVIGTHTHCQTNDAQILSTGVAYVTDVGMCGAKNGVLGFEKDSVVSRTIYHDENARFKLLDKDDTLFNAVVLRFDDLSYKCESLELINIEKREN